MKEKFINNSLAFIMKYQECDDLKIKKLKYGLEGIYNLIIKLIVVLLIATITNTLLTTVLLIIFYAGIRTFSFGWHANHTITCWATTIILYNGIPLLINNFNIPNTIGYIIFGLALIFMIFWAPADTPKRPLIRKKQRVQAKLLSIIIVIIYATIYLFTNFEIIKNTILYALIMQMVFINPLTYKLTKTQFNNYKYYKKRINNGLNLII